MLPRRSSAPSALALLILGLVATAAIAACGSVVPVTPICTTPGPATSQDSFSEHVTLTAEKDGLQVGDVNLGCGAQVRKGQQVTIEYTGWLKNGTEFDSSRSQGRQPVAFVLGQGQLIPGVEEGILGMNVGGKRRLVLPPALAYGAAGAPPVIPPNATIVFDIEVISVT